MKQQQTKFKTSMLQNIPYIIKREADRYNVSVDDYIKNIHGRSPSYYGYLKVDYDLVESRIKERDRILEEDDMSRMLLFSRDIVETRSYKRNFFTDHISVFDVTKIATLKTKALEWIIDSGARQTKDFIALYLKHEKGMKPKKSLYSDHLYYDRSDIDGVVRDIKDEIRSIKKQSYVFKTLTFYVLKKKIQITKQITDLQDQCLKFAKDISLSVSRYSVSRFLGVFVPVGIPNSFMQDYCRNEVLLKSGVDFAYT
jgi:hypothetical protein